MKNLGKWNPTQFVSLFKGIIPIFYAIFDTNYQGISHIAHRNRELRWTFRYWWGDGCMKKNVKECYECIDEYKR